MDYPYQDEHSGFSPERLADWQIAVDEISDLFGAHAREDHDFEIRQECPDYISIEIYLRNPQALPADTVMTLALSVRDVLRQRQGYWRVRIYLDPTSRFADICLWLDIDAYQIQPYRGLESPRERFETTEALRGWFWGSQATNQ